MLFTVFHIHGAFNAQMERRCDLFELCDIIRHALIVVIAECCADGAINVNVENRVVGRILPELQHAVTQPTHILSEQLAMLTQLGFHIVDERMGKNLRAFDDHFVCVGIAVIAGLREDVEGLIRHGASIFIGNNFAHHAAGSAGYCIEDRLGYAITDSSMQALAIHGDGFDHFGKAFEAVCLAANELGLDVCFDHGDEVLGEEQRVASARAAILHGSAVAIGNLAVFEDDHHGDGLARLAHGGEAGVTGEPT